MVKGRENGAFDVSLLVSLLVKLLACRLAEGDGDGDRMSEKEEEDEASGLCKRDGGVLVGVHMFYACKLLSLCTPSPSLLFEVRCLRSSLAWESCYRRTLVSHMIGCGELGAVQFVPAVSSRLCTWHSGGCVLCMSVL
jgi:hypothetical protein